MSTQSKIQANKKQWERMQRGCECADKAINEYFDNDQNSGTDSPYEQGTLADLLIGLRHLCDLKGMNFDQAVRCSSIEYQTEKQKFSYPENPACADMEIVGH